MSILGAILKGKKVGQKLLRAHRIKHGKRSPDIKTLKDMEATGQAEELKDYKGKGTGKWHKKGFE